MEEGTTTPTRRRATAVEEGTTTPTRRRATAVEEGTTTPTSRDVRRRRIMDRGSDRLALISGRIKTLPSEPDSPGPGSARGHSHTASCPPSMTHSQLSAVNAPSYSQDSLQNEDNTPKTAEKIMSRSLLDPYMRKSEISSEAYYKATTIGSDSKGQASQVMSTISSPRISSTPDDDSHHSETTSLSPRQTRSAITFTQVSAAFTATKSARLHCSLAVAIAVILSYIGFPILGSRFLGNLILFRPLCLLLWTNITVAVSQLLNKQGGGGVQKPKHHATSSDEPSVKGMADHIGNALEVGLMLQNVTGSLIMDCSIYIIIVICGLSLARTLGL